VTGRRRLAVGIAVFVVVAVGWSVFGGLSTLLGPTAAGSGGIGSVSIGIGEALVEMALMLVAVILALVVLQVVARIRSRHRDE
jgi:ABC-type methionine transport system permease subunit